MTNMVHTSSTSNVLVALEVRVRGTHVSKMGRRTPLPERAKVIIQCEEGARGARGRWTGAGLLHP